jgi:hypothetical protein
MKTRFRRVFSDGTMQVRVRVLGLQLAMRVGDNHLPRFVMMGGSRAGYAWNLMAGKRVGDLYRRMGWRMPP